MQHAETAVPPRSLTSRMLTMLHGFAGSRGTVTLAVRSRGGIEYPRLELTLPVTVLPVRLLDAVHDGLSLRVRAVSWEGGRPRDIGLAFAVFRPASNFDPSARNSRGAYVVEPEAQAAIREALRQFPLRATIVADGGNEVAVIWHLKESLALDRDERARATGLLNRLAERLGAEPVSDLAEVTLPLFGRQRSFNPTDYVELIDVAPERRYSLEAFEAALETARTLSRPRGDAKR